MMPFFPCIKRRIKILIVGQCKDNCGIQSYVLRQCSLLGPGLLMPASFAHGALSHQPVRMLVSRARLAWSLKIPLLVDSDLGHKPWARDSNGPEPRAPVLVPSCVI